MSDLTCCLDLEKQFDIPISSPFSQMIVLGWFDGPTDGLVICGSCGRSYKFAVLASDGGSYDFSAWDEGHELTIFGLSEFTKEQFDIVFSALADGRTPTWPIWFIGSHNDPENFEMQSLSDNKALETFWQIGDPSLALAIHMGDMLTEILRARHVSLDAFLEVSGDLWFELLGYSKQLRERTDT